MKNEFDAARCDKHLDNYKAHIAATNRIVQNGDTWFNNWQDEKWSQPPESKEYVPHNPEMVY